MTRAEYKDKDLVVSILVNSFQDNKSVNFIISQDNKRLQRIKGLMEYSYEVCNLFGDVFLSDDRRGCALLILPDKKRTTIKSILLDARFVLACLSLSNVKKAMKRQAKIQQVHPSGMLYYLWFIGVSSSEQHKGTGTRLMNEIIAEANAHQRIICLETSTVQNIPWYQKFNFTIYKEFDFGYKLYCLKKDLPK
jgi:ribosomal protein S18 acetylase RimI-like enzyme